MNIGKKTFGFLFILGVGEIHIPGIMVVYIHINRKRHALLTKKKM